MKKIFTYITIFIIGTQLANSQEQSFDLAIKIKNLTSNQGQILVGIYNNSTSFLKKPFKANAIKIKNKKSQIIFKNLPKGEYAVSFVHDKNKNNKLDTNFIGIPIEDYNCSNNAKGFMGPPKYKDAKFLLEKNIEIELSI